MMLKRRGGVLRAVGVALAAAVVATAAMPAPAQAVKRKCGYVSCTFYLNKSETTDFASGVGITAIPVAFIPVAGPLTAASLGLNAGIISIAVNHNQCVKLKVGPSPVSPARIGITQGFYKCP